MEKAKIINVVDENDNVEELDKTESDTIKELKQQLKELNEERIDALAANARIERESLIKGVYIGVAVTVVGLFGGLVIDAIRYRE